MKIREIEQSMIDDIENLRIALNLPHVQKKQKRPIDYQMDAFDEKLRKISDKINKDK